MKLRLEIPDDSSIKLGVYPQILDEHEGVLADWYGTHEQATTVVKAVNEQEELLSLVENTADHWTRLPGAPTAAAAQAEHYRVMDNFVKRARAVLDRAKESET